MQIITLKEEEDLSLPRDAIEEDLILRLWRVYGERVKVEFPTPMTDFCYVLRSKGYVGQIPLSHDTVLRILPKVPLNNIFGMLEYAYNLKSFHFLDGATNVESLEDLFERLVSILAKKVLDRVRKGLYQGYVKQEECLRYQRGRILVLPTLRSVQRGNPHLECEYEEQTVDLIDNQILAWTLFQLPRFGLRREEVRRQVQQAYRALAGTVTVNLVESRDCILRFYHRLNDDYKPMHGLCRFFLEHSGPGQEMGSHEFIPFLVDMPRLFEAFIAQWLKINSPGGTYIKPQYDANLDQNGTFSFRIDLVLNDSSTDRVLAVMDTKYKREDKPIEEDIKDIVAYAVRMDTKNGFLIYPSTRTDQVSLNVGNIEVKSLIFDLSRNPDEEGVAFLKKITDFLKLSLFKVPFFTN